MPILDYECAVCGLIARDVYRPLYRLPTPRVVHGYKVTQDFDHPLCERCLGHELRIVMNVIPPRVTVDALEPMQEFETVVEDGHGGHKVEHIDSLAKLRKVERESEVRYRNGVGRPLVWRDYSNDRSNRDVHTIAADPAPALTRAQIRKHAPKVATPEEVDALGLGPGVTDDTESPLESL